MIRTWLEEAIDYAKDMKPEEFELIKSKADLTCEKCGTCCIVAKLDFLNKPANVRCIHLTEDNLCSLHGAEKPHPCQDYPYMNDMNWVLDWRLGAPRWSIWFCGIIRKFWLAVHKHKEETQK